MSHSHDDPIERLLHEHFAGAVPDDGFCDRVMPHLPVRRRHRAWPLWSGLAIGALAGAASLWSLPILRTGLRDWLGAAPTTPAALGLLLVLAAMSLLAMCWSLGESGAR